MASQILPHAKGAVSAIGQEMVQGTPVLKKTTQAVFHFDQFPDLLYQVFSLMALLAQWW